MIRVAFESTVTPQLVEEAMPLIRVLFAGVKGAQAPVLLNIDFLRSAAESRTMRVITARDGDRMVGFAVLFVYDTISNEKHVNIRHIIVAKAYRGKEHGIADQMVMLARTLADGLNARCLTDAESDLLVDLFKRNGFVVTGVTMEAVHE